MKWLPWKFVERSIVPVQSSCKEEEGEDQVTVNVCCLSEDIRWICI